MSTTTPLALPVAPAVSGIAYRRWAGFDDLPGMALASTRMRERCGLLEPADMESMHHVYTHLINSDPATDCIIAGLDGVTVGYARTEWHDLTDGDRAYSFASVVDPGAWGMGITEAFVGWCEARLRQIAADHDGARRAWFDTYAFDGTEELERVLLERGYRAVRWDAEMLRETMDDLPDVPDLPDGYEIRPAPPERLRDVGAMLVDAFRDHWGEIEESEDEIRDWLENPRFDAGLVTVVWHGETPVACAGSQVQPHADGGTIGYVDVVATAAGHRRLGLARAVLADTLHRLAGRGVTRAYIGVDTDNEQRAFALYEDAGFRRSCGSATYRKPFDKQETRP